MSYSLFFSKRLSFKVNVSILIHKLQLIKEYDLYIPNRKLRLNEQVGKQSLVYFLMNA